ncbi:sensor histidine kinase [Gilvimarinus sp. DA14]|uniref:sensor histidine kinase n=1 Tax=Gilvimarinus sp. DA14 TaxID=2956798 RepID=UPI0020B7D585|nr:sensor histidine kinase [Gilvimarinus sp. DA14]UTF60129.1 sensor histidine kinase [Gilvimarinus sp. DA14]
MYAESNAAPDRLRISRPWSWLSFMFSAFYFFSFFSMPLTSHFVLTSLFFYGLFTLCYARLTDCPLPWVLPMLLVMLTLAIISTRYNPSAGVIFGYTAFFAGFYLNRWQALVALGVICSSIFFAAHVHNLWHSYFILPSIIPTVCMAFMGLYIQTTTRFAIREEENAEEKRQLIKVAERERIARDLHDTLGHTLSSIALKAQLAKKLGDKGDTQQALREINEVATLASESLSEVRQAISGYRKTGLGEQLANLKEKLKAAGFTTRVSQQLTKPAPVIEATLMLIITESVTNIVRHSSGSAASIHLSESDKDIQLIVSDDGSTGQFAYGHGLRGIKERAEELGGGAEISNTNGFQIRVIIPHAE